jgi:ornithine cyclodeaminase/alanine dehydrogenase-like protein (mu-crystallin family)
VTLLVLSAGDVRALLGYAQCAEAMRTALAGLARGEIQQPLRTVVRPAGAAGMMALMPSYAADAGYGLKAICITPGNPARGLDTHQGGVLLSAADTGEPLALVNASALTEIRTAAVSAVATDLLARADATEVAIIGTGVQAFAHARALAATWPLGGKRLAGIRMAGRDLERVRDRSAALSAELNLPLRMLTSVPDALDGAGIVVTATNSPEPVLRREWLAPGAHINAVGACVPGEREIDSATMVAAAVFADSQDSLSSESGDYLLAGGRPVLGPPRATLGEVLTGAAPGRLDDAEITLFESLGLAAEDLAAAAYVYAQARQAGGVGTEADF